MKKNRLDIVHIYHGAMGNNGLYLHKIIEALQANGYIQEAYVSFFYPFNYGKKYFYRFTDLSSKSHFTHKIRLVVRYLELILGLILTFISIARRKPKIVNYSLIQTFPPEILFLKAIKIFSKAKLIITCHDVVPFSNKFISKEKSLKIRKKLFLLSDYLIVHNNNSISDLMQIYNVNRNKILFHPFPLMDISTLVKSETNEELESDFLFIGHMREEKGISLLLKAWSEYVVNHPDHKLMIAGTNPNNYNFSEYKKINVKTLIGYIEDETYVSLIKSTRFVVLPYLRGTNSGVVSTVLGLGKIPICSDIPMFSNNPLILPELLFKSESVSSLVEKMDYMQSVENHTDINILIKEYESDFQRSVIQVYSQIFR